MKLFLTQNSQCGAVKAEYTILSSWFLLFLFIGMVNLGVESETTLCRAAAASNGLNDTQAEQYVRDCVSLSPPPCQEATGDHIPNLECQRNPGVRGSRQDDEHDTDEPSSRQPNVFGDSENDEILGGFIS